MSDPFDVLRSPDPRTEPDVDFRRRVMHDVDLAIDSRNAVAVGDEGQELTVGEDMPADPAASDGHRRRYFVVLAAAAVVIVAVAAAVLLRDHESAEPVVNQTPTTTVAFDSGFAAEIARATLIDPGTEYGGGWSAAPLPPIALDRAVAADVPGCAPFLDAVFESPARPARVDYRFLHLDDPTTFTSQYVVVLPSEAQAEAMFDAMVDPSFQDGCFQPYYEHTDAFGGWCCDPTKRAAPPLFGTPVESDAAVGADEVQRRLQTDAFWTDEAGVSHGPERRESATMRVGRAIIVMDAVLTSESGDDLMSEGQFDTALALAAVRALSMGAGSDG